MTNKVYKRSENASDKKSVKTAEKFHKLKGFDPTSLSGFWKTPMHCVRFFYWAVATNFYKKWKSGRYVIQFQIVDTKTWTRNEDHINVHIAVNKACVADLKIPQTMSNDLNAYGGFLPTKGAIKAALASLLTGKEPESNVYSPEEVKQLVRDAIANTPEEEDTIPFEEEISSMTKEDDSSAKE
jgi:hypothetical protein